MQQQNRPLSPHLQVYRPQLTSVLSILHRITGFGLAAGAPLAVWWLYAVIGGAESYGEFYGFCKSIVGQLMLFGWLFAFVYHALNGIRHMVWDTGAWLDIKSTYASGWVVFLSSVILSIVLWVVL